MLRILWILSLAFVIGAHRHESWKSFFETLAHELNVPLDRFSRISPEVSTVGWHTESSSENPCKSYSKCHPDSVGSSANPVSTAKPGSLDDYSLHENTPASSQQQQVGSMKGTPGENFPDYTDIPVTSFSCSDKDFVPGFYADLESGCQVFHACWPHRRESFLCPVGTIFNQALLACDYWYSSNCSLAPHYYKVNGYPLQSTETKDTPEGSMIHALLGTGHGPSEEELHKIITSEPDTMAFISQFLPVKAKVTIYPETSGSKAKIVATASIGKRKKRHHSTTESNGYTKEPQSTPEAVQTEETPYSTLSPDCRKTVKYINVEEAVKLAFDRLEKILKVVMQEVKDYMAAYTAKKACSTGHDDISLLTKIGQKLIPRPLVPPMVKEKPTITSKTDTAVEPTATKPPVADFHRKPVFSKTKHSSLSISPLTKKVLIESYIKLLKLRKS